MAKTPAADFGGLCQHAPGSAWRRSVAFARFGGKVFFKFARFAVILLGVGRRIALDCDIRPFFGIFGVDRQPFLKTGFGIGPNGVDRAFRLADAESMHSSG